MIKQHFFPSFKRLDVKRIGTFSDKRLFAGTIVKLEFILVDRPSLHLFGIEHRLASANQRIGTFSFTTGFPERVVDDTTIF